MASADDDFDPEELADFAELAKDDERMKRLEKFTKWRDREKTRTPSPTPSAPNQWDDPPLSVLSRLTGNPGTRSILEHLLKIPLQSPADQGKGKGQSGEGARQGAAGGSKLKLI